MRQPDATSFWNEEKSKGGNAVLLAVKIFSGDILEPWTVGEVDLPLY